MAKSRGNNGTATYDPRQLWATNLAPLVAAAREGAAHAARTASRERVRARQEPAWWRQRWVIITTAGVAALGAAGGVYAILASRRSRTSRHAMPGSGTGLGDQSQENGFKSTVEAGRAKVSDVARNMVHKLRDSETDQLSPEAPPTPEPAGSLGSVGEHPTDGGYHGQP